jgi:long-chain acyl-CoA synthetase
MAGYWNKPEETAHALRGGWMHTGDIGFMDEDGFLFIVDRLKDMIVTGGENVYTTEVESAIYHHPAVAMCAVIGIPDDIWGEKIHAVVVVKQNHSLDEQELITLCREYIAGYKVPRSVEIRHEPLPMSGAGKILKRELRAPFWEDKSRSVN